MLIVMLVGPMLKLLLFHNRRRCTPLQLDASHLALAAVQPRIVKHEEQTALLTPQPASIN